MVLIQIINNANRETRFAQEIITLVREYKSKNVLMSAGFSRQITLNFATFNELIPCSCLVDELQYTLFGYYLPAKKMSVVREKLSNKLLKFMTNHSRIYDDSDEDIKTIRKEPIRKTMINQFEETEEERRDMLTDFEKRLKLDPVDEPDSPFMVIEGLTQTLEDALIEKLKK